ncbi:MAG: stage 0 sporulation family protein [Peptococcaceae bacterium]|nr:stage 0 sporulation family protein [Peptococcaceae bacterium]
MSKVVGVRFKKAGKIYYFDPGELSLEVEDEVVVETARGIEYGEVVVGPTSVPDEEVVAPLKKVLRRVTGDDRRQLQENREKEARAFQVGLDKIAAHGLPMKLVGVEQTFDGSKIIFYFTADGRIDFRELVKDLAAVFRTRIELRQIGVRDEAKMMGGLGCCGRELCCSTWLSDFASVSIRMAKDQNLSLNPTKISGICGRLMCCLKYENDTYEQAREEFPETGSRVITPQGEGKVTGINIFKKTVAVELQESKAVKEYPADEIIPKGVTIEDELSPGSNDQADGNKNAGNCGRFCKA